MNEVVAIADINRKKVDCFIQRSREARRTNDVGYPCLDENDRFTFMPPERRSEDQRVDLDIHRIHHEPDCGGERDPG